MPPTPPHVSLDILRTLHRLHRQLTDLRDRKEYGPKRVRAAEAHVTHREAELAKSQADLKKFRVATDQKQLQLKSGEDKIKDLQRKLNTATSNREYQALKDQIAADNMAGSVLSDEILEALEKVDQSQTKIHELDATLAAARKKAEAVRAEVQKLAPTLQGDIDRLDAELKQAEAALPPAIRDVYQRVVRSRGEDALAAVENEFCGGCNQHVPVNVCAEILLGHPMFCRSCGRLLYVPESTAPQSPAAKE
jgi:uncharacterized protein